MAPAHVSRSLLLALGLGLGLCPGAQAQDAGEERPEWRVDPYTGNEPDAWAAVGYARGERFNFGDDHGNKDVEELLGTVQLRWVETAHFRIGSSLPEVKIHKDEKKRLKDELDRLSERLPKLKSNAKTLDPWLRLHLYAMRLEDHYSRFQSLLGLTDADFPGPNGRAPAGAPQRGNGPYLGMKEKFPVLLLEKKSSLGRYVNRWGGVSGSAGESPQILTFNGLGCMGYAVAWELFSDSAWDFDSGLHANLAWSMTQVFAASFKGYTHRLPIWFTMGLGNAFQRDVDPRYPTLFGVERAMDLAVKEWDWPPKVRARVKNEAFSSLDEMFRWRANEPRAFSDCLMAWSKVDWMLAHNEQGQFARFMDLVSDAVPAPRGKAPSDADVEAAARAALQTAWGLDPAAFDMAWAEWVVDTYPKK